ncbi:MAG: hypothetical protein AAF616_13670 [Bacteroidota bacterium]
MENRIKIYSIVALLFSLSCFTAQAEVSNRIKNYWSYHLDIKAALEESDVKKARSLVEDLLPILASDIKYTEDALADAEDEFVLKDLQRRVGRQLEIQGMLSDFLSLKKGKIKEFDSLDVIKELRRLSIKPKSR